MEKENILINFIKQNIDINNLDLFLKSFGQRYLLLKALGKEDTSEYKQLSLLFENLELAVSSNKEGDIIFKKIVKEKPFHSFLKKIKKENIEDNYKLSFINDIMEGRIKILII